MRKITKIIFLLAFVYSTLCFSQVKLPSFFNNNMVLQQNTLVSIWGTDKPASSFRTDNWKN
ncbi:hypothetical protein [Lutibacter citreus]|uniref:hypothetical protein n=1 Tax=Lutibacter citreus TaxID=2138210 RepID=UPI000DBE92EA|nr:hypothetical protein [Lutibacter citreus]